MIEFPTFQFNLSRHSFVLPHLNLLSSLKLSLLVVAASSKLRATRAAAKETTQLAASGSVVRAGRVRGRPSCTRARRTTHPWPSPSASASLPSKCPPCSSRHVTSRRRCRRRRRQRQRQRVTATKAARVAEAAEEVAEAETATTGSSCLAGCGCGCSASPPPPPHPSTTEPAHCSGSSQRRRQQPLGLGGKQQRQRDGRVLRRRF